VAAQWSWGIGIVAPLSHPPLVEDCRGPHTGGKWRGMSRKTAPHILPLGSQPAHPSEHYKASSSAPLTPCCPAFAKTSLNGPAFALTSLNSPAFA
jgi:hypothetical protein